jgi:pSer/pThr/pTyr-binding forkhead associated (FHA) protein
MDEQPTFIIVDGDAAAPPRTLAKPRISIGHHPDSDARLDDYFTVSATHAAIEWDGAYFNLTDVDPANATLLNHEQLACDIPQALADGDVIQIGPYLLQIGRDERTLRIEVLRLLLPSNFILRRIDGEQTTETKLDKCAGLLICNPPDQQTNDADTAADANKQTPKLILNHPKVSPVHAGISRLRDHFDKTKWQFYLIDLSPSNTTYLSNRLLITDEPQPIKDEDVAQIGPYDLTFNLPDEPELAGTLDITVTQGVTLPAPMRPESVIVPASDGAANALRIFWDKRTRTKETRRTLLHPEEPVRIGKARYRWRSTTDLARPWAATIIFWGTLAAVLIILSVYLYSGMNAFAPRPLAQAHARTNFSSAEPVALRPNAAACNTCHARGQRMNDACAGCHQSAVFAATVTDAHKAAGIGCTDCHSEHRGADFRPGVEPLSVSFQPGVRAAETCAGCHNDANPQRYNGRAVHTPHTGEFRGRFGYPYADGRWIWPGLTSEELAEKREDYQAQLARYRKFWPHESENKVIDEEFHALHFGRVRASEVGLKDDGKGMLGCSSCHNSLGANLDRTTPRQTCALCHDGRKDVQTGRMLIAADQSNCASCHIQHVLDKRRNPALLAPVEPRAQTAQASVAGPR